MHTLWLSNKESSCNAGDAGSIPGWERSPGEGNGSPLQYSCLGNPMDRGAWWVTLYRVTKSWTWLSDWTTTPYLTSTIVNILPILFHLSSHFPPFFLEQQTLHYFTTKYVPLTTKEFLTYNQNVYHICQKINYSILSLNSQGICQFPWLSKNFKLPCSN